MTTTPGPFGAAVRQARENAHLSVRRAAEKAGMSEGRWRQLELGYQSVAGTQIPARPSARTVRAMARVLDLDQRQMLELAGLPPEEADPNPAGSFVEVEPTTAAIIAAIDAHPRLNAVTKAHLINQLQILEYVPAEVAELLAEQARRRGRAGLEEAGQARLRAVEDRPPGNGPNDDPPNRRKGGLT